MFLVEQLVYTYVCFYPGGQMGTFIAKINLNLSELSENIPFYTFGHQGHQPTSFVRSDSHT